MPCSWIPEPLLPHGPVLVQKPREHQLRRIFREPVELDSADLPDREPSLHVPDVLLEPADHDLLEGRLAHLDALGETVGIQQFQQRRKAS